MIITPPKFVQQDVALAPYTTFGIGGPAKWFAVVNTADELSDILKFCTENKIHWFILGKGSNSLFDDMGFNGMVLLNKLNFMQEKENGAFLAGSGYSFARLGASTSRSGWTGLEFASGIPGSVGGAVYMNAGANGTDTAATLAEVHYMHPYGNIQIYKKSDLHFDYRHSSFQGMKGAIIAASFHLTPSEEAKSKQQSMLAYRTSTQPYGEKSAGCVFRNPEGDSAGALIDRCGLKGYSIGGAVVSSLHGNFIVNQGGATAKDVLALMTHIHQTIKDKYGIEMVSEVCYVPSKHE